MQPLFPPIPADAPIASELPTAPEGDDLDQNMDSPPGLDDITGNVEHSVYNAPEGA
jgi:hypothetical protein